MSKDRDTGGGRTIRPVRRLRGSLRVPGDKSISHRCLMFGAVAEGVSRYAGLGPGEDVRTTRRVVETLGVAVRDEGGTVVLEGTGWAGLDRADEEAPRDLDCGNAGTTARLLCGLLAGRHGRYRLIGDASLSSRPMGRVTRPLGSLGARFEGGETLPITIVGSPLKGGTLGTGVASAQVKSALMLAALQAEGTSVISEQRPTRDHTERLLGAMGAPIRPIAGDEPTWRIAGGAPPLRPLEMTVPGDPSSAAYAVALGALLDGSEVIVEGVSVNPSRIGFYRILSRMGARVTWESASEAAEPIGVIRVESSDLRGIRIGAEDVVDAIDEIPLLTVVAAAATGDTVIAGAEELRKKESDRITTTVAMLRAFGAEVEERPDGMRVEGGTKFHPADVDAGGDHRIGMCATVAAALCDGPSRLTGHRWVAISYPGFFDDLEELAS